MTGPTPPVVEAGALIVGASQAGAQLAISLREAGHSGTITLIGAEPHLPYQRPPLSKALLTGAADVPSLQLRAPEFYRQHGIRVLLDERVSHVEWDDSAVADTGLAFTARGRRLRFQQLALTTGARPRRWDVPGAALDGVCYLRDVDDALRLRDRLARGTRAVVIGGGFIGLEAAAAATTLGVDVTVVEATDRVMSRVVATVVSDFYQRAHRKRGVDLRLGREVRAVRATGGRVAGVELDDGTVVPAHTVIVGIGIVPRTELAEQLGLDCAGGILVDEQARTSSPAVVAAGDCTVMHHPVTGQGRVRLESVANAVAQARAAAATLARVPHPGGEVPWFWSDQFDLKLQMAGLAGGYDELVVRGDPASERFSVLYYRGGSLLAVHAVNRPADYLAGRAALARRATIPAEAAARADVDLRHLVTVPAPAPAVAPVPGPARY